MPGWMIKDYEGRVAQRREGIPLEEKRLMPQDVTKRQSISNTETDHLKSDLGTVAGNREACLKSSAPMVSRGMWEIWSTLFSSGPEWPAQHPLLASSACCSCQDRDLSEGKDSLFRPPLKPRHP